MIMHAEHVEEEETTTRAGHGYPWGTWVGMMALLSALLILGGCAMAPGGHIDEDKIGESLDERVALEPITPQLVAAMAPVQESLSRPVSEALRSALESYEYRLGPGDVLSIIVYDHPELTIPAGAERAASETGNPRTR